MQFIIIKMVKVAAVLVAALALSAAGFMAFSPKTKVVSEVPASVRAAFTEWKLAHAKVYASPQEELYRLSVFFANFLKISKHADPSYKLGLNLFSDLTEKEFVAKYTGINQRSIKNADERNVAENPIADPPASVDWRTQGAVNPVQNQGQCGSCWAFSAIASLEGVAKINGYPLYKLSEQQLVDCSTAEGNHGCNGGLMDNAFNYIKQNGIELETTYPYKGADEKCKATQAQYTNVVVTGWQDVPQDDCNALLAAIALNPTSVAIAANAIQFYTSGVFSSKFCGTGLNHGVTAVGYGTDSTSKKDFWLVRNSWGASWGEQGYIRMDRAIQPKTGICGICMAASYPQVKSP